MRGADQRTTKASRGLMDWASPPKAKIAGSSPVVSRLVRFLTGSRSKR